MSGFNRWAVTLIAATTALAGFVGESEARARFNLFVGPPVYPGYEVYYGEPAYMPPPPPPRRFRYYYEEAPPPYAYARPLPGVAPGQWSYYQDDEDDYYGDQYDPRNDLRTEQPLPDVQRPAQKPANRPLAVPKTQSATKKAAPKISCTKAGQVVSGYGFGNVKSVDCDGQVYAFNATRDGKKFSIKLNAASGELTEVKKL